MKIIGKDGKVYETVKECLKADEAYEEAQAAKEKAEVEKKNAISVRKKELADAVQAAEEGVATAQAELDEVREEARKLIDEAQLKARDMIKEATEKYREASGERYKAIQNFNKEFGTYTTTYTGQKALEEYNRWNKHFNDVFENLFRGWF